MAVFTFNQDPVDSVLSIGGGSRADGVFTIGGTVDQAAEASAAASASDGAFSGFSGACTIMLTALSIPLAKLRCYTSSQLQITEAMVESSSTFTTNAVSEPHSSFISWNTLLPA